MKRIVSLLLLSLAILPQLVAQNNEQDFMRSIGKIYVVVAVIIAVFLGIVFFLFYLDRRLTKLENQINEND